MSKGCREHVTQIVTMIHTQARTHARIELWSEYLKWRDHLDEQMWFRKWYCTASSRCTERCRVDSLEGQEEVVVTVLINLWVPWKAWNFLRRRVTTSFRWSTLFYWISINKRGCGLGRGERVDWKEGKWIVVRTILKVNTQDLFYTLLF
jgi:hypothetical protein